MVLFETGVQISIFIFVLKQVIVKFDYNILFLAPFFYFRNYLKINIVILTKLAEKKNEEIRNNSNEFLFIFV